MTLYPSEESTVTMLVIHHRAPTIVSPFQGQDVFGPVNVNAAGSASMNIHLTRQRIP